MKNSDAVNSENIYETEAYRWTYSDSQEGRYFCCGFADFLEAEGVS